MPVDIDVPRPPGPGGPVEPPGGGPTGSGPASSSASSASSASGGRTGRRSGRALWWLIPEALVLALFAVLLSTGVGTPTDLRTDLAGRIGAMLEESSPAEHHDHGHEVTTEDSVFCAAQVIATEPPDATDVSEVTKVYATYLCAAGRPGVDFTWSSRASGPVVAEFDRTPPVVRIPAPGLGYEQRVRELFPDQYENAALRGQLRVEVAGEVRRRYEEAFPPAKG